MTCGEFAIAELIRIVEDQDAINSVRALELLLQRAEIPVPEKAAAEGTYAWAA